MNSLSSQSSAPELDFTIWPSLFIMKVVGMLGEK